MAAAVPGDITRFLLMTYTKETVESFALFLRRRRGWLGRWEGRYAWAWSGLAGGQFQVLGETSEGARLLQAALDHSRYLTAEQTLAAVGQQTAGSTGVIGR